MGTTQIAKGIFRRMSPAAFSERVELPQGWIVLRFNNLPEKIARRATHGQWVVLIHGSHKVYRIVRYSVTMPKNEIVLDWAGWLDLQGRIADLDQEVALTIRTPQWWELLVVPFKHIDPGYRMSAWLGSISLALGVVSVAPPINWRNVFGGLSGGLSKLAGIIFYINQHIN